MIHQPLSPSLSLSLCLSVCLSFSPSPPPPTLSLPPSPPPLSLSLSLSVSLVLHFSMLLSYLIQVGEFLDMWQLPSTGQLSLPLLHKLKALSGVTSEYSQSRKLTERKGIMYILTMYMYMYMYLHMYMYMHVCVGFLQCGRGWICWASHPTIT